MSETKNPQKKKNSKKRRRLNGWYVQQHARAARRKDARVLKSSRGLVLSVEDSVQLQEMDSISRLTILNTRRVAVGLPEKFFSS